MATDHKGNPLHAGKRTNDETTNYPRITGFREDVAIHREFEEQHGRRMTRREHNEAFTHPADVTYGSMELEDPDGKIFIVDDYSKPKYKPMFDYPYTKKTRKKGVKAINPPPKRRVGGTSKTTENEVPENKRKGIPKDENYGKPSNKTKDPFY